MKVTKRNKNTEEYDIEKIHRIVNWACEGLDVSKSEIELSMNLKLYENITTREIHESLIESAKNLITKLENPDYSKVAANLLNYKLRKEVYGSYTTRNLLEIIKENISRKVYDSRIIQYYSESEWEELNNYIDHDRDFTFEHSGLKTVIDSYLAQDRVTKQAYETPQIAFMIIAAIKFHREKKDRIHHVKNYYDLISQFVITLPTPVMGGVRTPINQYSSCTLIECADNLDSIQKTDEAILKYASNRAGIGILADIRGLGQPVKNGAIKHTGIVPFIKKFEATMNSVSQGAIRKGSATVSYIGWHIDFETIVSMKNEKGERDTRVFGMDISIMINGLFYQRLIEDKDITLFSPEEVPELKRLFFSSDLSGFYREYEKCEANDSLKKKKIPAKEYFKILLTERFETARVYIIHIDLVNSQTPFIEPIKMSNLCLEICLPTKPMSSDGSGLIALCTLGAINWGKIKNPKDLEKPMWYVVRGMNHLLDLQNYPVTEAKNHTELYRPLGIGINNLAYFLAKRGLKYSHGESAKVVGEFVEAMQYYAIKASLDFRKDFPESCEKLLETKYSYGIFNHVHKEVSLNMDWESLGKEVRENNGIANSTLTAIMPSESSSLISNSTNGIEPIRSHYVTKKGSVVIAPNLKKLKNKYETLWDIESPRGYLEIVSSIQNFIDQSISANTSYNSSRFFDGKMPLQTLFNDLYYSYTLGIKTLYYCNDAPEDEKVVEKSFESNDSCESCTI